MVTDTADIFDRCKRLIAKGAENEEIISLLKEKGFPQSVTVGFLIRLGVDSVIAKRAVIESRAWKDNREATEALHEAIERELDKSPNIFEE